MKRLTLSVLSAAVIFTAGSGITVAAKTKDSSQTVVVSPNDKRDYATINLENGITALLVSDPTVDKSAAALSVGVGLLHDPMTQQGMAHYLEHMLFLGTDRFPDTNGYNDFMSKNGGSSNAYTWLDITNYMFEINNDAYDDALDRFSDFFKAPKLYPEYTDKEKNAVNAEWSMRREMDFFGMYKLNRSMMGEHPANRFLIGNLETLSDKENAKLHPQTVEFYNQYYSANVMKVAMVSNQPIKEMKKLAKKHFSSIKNKKIDKPVVTAKLDFDKVGGKRIHYVPNQDVKNLILDFTIKNNQQEYKTKPNRFIGYLLGSEMPGTPAYVLKKAGLISSLSSNAAPDLYGNYGRLSIDIELTDAGLKAREEITRVVMSYIEKIKKEGVDSKYFNEIKTSLNNRFRFLEKGNAFGYVSNLADEMQSYPVRDVISAPYTYEQFDEKSVNNTLKQLSPTTLRIWYVSKNEPHDKEMHFYDGKYKIVDIDKKEIASWKKPTKYALELPKVNTMLPEGFDIKTDASNKQEKPVVAYDKKGITVWQYPSQAFSSQPKGVLRVFINSPEREKSIQGQILFDLWSDLYNLKQSALATEASIAGMNLNMYSTNGLELSVSGFTDKQPLLLEKGLKAITFKVDQTGFKQAVDRYIRGVKNQEKQFPIYQLFDSFNDVISSSGYSNKALVAAAKKLKPEDLTHFMEKVMANNQIRVFAFGNYDKKDVDYYVSQIDKAMPENRKVTDYVRTRVLAPKKGQTVSLKRDLDVADVAVYDLHVHPEPSVKQEARGMVLRDHLRTVTFDKLRTEEQLAYAVTAIAPKIKDYAALGFAIQTPVKNVEEMQQRFDAFKKEYVEKLNAITPEEFSKLKNSVLISLKEKPKNLSEEQAPILNDWYDENWDFDTRKNLIAEVEKVTLDDIKAFYHETVGDKNASRLSIQLRGSKFKDKSFAKLEGETEIKDLAEFHKKASYQK
ncbi:insulinase family protein [Aliikangiella coralliicola]|uniref:Protease 3 n=1 Tax=Aliikangiella coralliicola TaxID=2592383 RepID=A0A545U607_9GAMM|nr:insulinase family protein [Aliikangiella coralliicola]TQV84909.1 peptidase M16 [Aliikangiella coralliicola]